MTWVKHNQEKRAVHLPDLLKKIRMPLLSPQYLTDRVATESLIRGSHECRFVSVRYSRRDIIICDRLVDGTLMAWITITSG